MTKQVFNFDSSILNTFQSCARKYEYTFLKNISPLEKAGALESGDLMHKMLEIYYSLQVNNFSFDTPVWREVKNQGLIPPARKTFPDLQKFSVQAGRYFATKLSLPDEEIEECIYQYQEYTNHYEHDSWNPLAVEEVGSKVLYEDDDLTILYSFKIDLVAEQGNVIAPFDHKTARRREEPSSVSNQFIGYCYGLGLNHIVVNKIGFQKTLSRAQRFNRFILTVDDERIEEWKQNTVFWAMQMIHSQSRNHYPMNLTSCDKYSGCIYRDLCESSPSARDWKMETQFKVSETWDVAKELEKEK